MLEVPAGTDAETATLVWLIGALQWAREGGRERLVGYLEAVADDAVFEAEAAARRGPGLREVPRRPHARSPGMPLPRTAVNKTGAALAARDAAFRVAPEGMMVRDVERSMERPI